MTLRMQIYETFEDPSFSWIAKWYSIAMMILIVLATACFVLESEATIETGGLYNTNALYVFEQIELASVIIFSLEYLIRFACCPCENRGYIKFILDINNMIDLLACLPYWVTFIIQKIDPQSSQASLGFVRVIRLIRIFRVFKFGKYSTGIHMLVGAISKSMQPLSILLFVIVLAVIILSSVMYMAEGALADSNHTSYDEDLLNMAGVEAVQHMYCFGTIPRTFWWAVVTMTTVGYGDCFPVSTAGKILAMATMILGLVIIALPITVVGSNFQKMVEMYEEENTTMHEFDVSEDGVIDEQELRAFIAAKRKDNALRKDVDLNPARLMRKFDPQGEGVLSFTAFQSLKREIIDIPSADQSTNIRTLLKRSLEQEETIRQMREQLDRIEKLVGGSLPKTGTTEANGTYELPGDSTRSLYLPPVHARVEDGEARAAECG